MLSTGCQQAIGEPQEFKKLVYESKFTKRAEEMSFVNFILACFRAASLLANNNDLQRLRSYIW